jgi:4-hydroxy-tetrahydrodipicolinate synthase
MMETTSMPLASPLTGIIPPVCTPMTEQFEVDVPSLERLLRFQLDDGVHGVFMLGSTSETATLTDAQRKTVLDVAVQTVAGQVPVLAGVIDFSTARQIGHARVAHETGVDALVATGPFYIHPSQDEIVQHFRYLREAVDLPIFAYDIPSAVQIKLERQTIATLASEGLIVGFKDSSGQDANFRGVVLDTREIAGFAALTGSELMVDTMLQLGASGAVPGFGNVDPAGFVRIYDAVLAGDLALARREQERLYRLFEIVKQAPPGRTGRTAASVGAFKTALFLRGVIANNVVGRPMTRLNDEETARIRDILVEAELL